MASYPSTIKTFTTFVNGDDIDASNQNEPNDEITAVETGLLQGFAHNVYAPGFRYNDAASKTIASGVITITSGYLEVDTEGAAASDDLDTITIGVMSDGVAIGEGSVVILQPASAARVVTVKNGTGNISMLSGDYAMTSLLSRLVLLYNGAAWVEIGRAGLNGWVTPTFAAGTYTGANSQTWTVGSGDVTTNRYKMLDASTMVWQIKLVTTTVGGTPDPALRITLPAGKTIASSVQAWGRMIDNGGTAASGLVDAVSGLTYVSLYPTVSAASNWSAATNATALSFEITLEVS